MPLTVNISAETASAKPNASIFVDPSRKKWSTTSTASTLLSHSQFHLNLSDGNLIAPRSLAAKGVWEMYILALKPLQYKKYKRRTMDFYVIVGHEIGLLLRLLLSCFSRVQLCATPWMAAYQAPPSMGFSRQEH